MMIGGRTVHCVFCGEPTEPENMGSSSSSAAFTSFCTNCCAHMKIVIEVDQSTVRLNMSAIASTQLTPTGRTQPESTTP